MIAGVLSCGLTHTAVCPLDVVKCNMQVDPVKYTGLSQGLKTVIAEEGSMGIWKGWAPTLIGYSMQGFCKFGFYEVFKDLYANALGHDTFMANKGAVWLAASASAEFFCRYCPLPNGDGQGEGADKSR